MVGFVTQNMAEIPPDMAHNAIDTQNAPAGSFGEIARTSFNQGITPSILSYSHLLGERIGNQLRDEPLPKLSPQDIKGKYGIKVDAPMEDFEAKYIADAQHNEKQYQMAAQNASGIKTFAADSVAFLSDPINLGSMFIPVAGQARVGAALGLDAGTIAGRAATRAITFGTAGAVSQAPLSAIKFGLSQTQHTDYGIADAMRDTLFAGAVGTIAGPLFGGLKDMIMGSPKWADVVQRFQRMKYGDNQAIAQIGQAQMAKENLVDVEPLFTPLTQTAFHGGPHDYDKVDLGKIGSGEGNQAWGWGHYSAGAQETAEKYRDNLSSPTIDRIKQYFTPGNIVDAYGGKDRVLSFNDEPNGRWSVTVERIKQNDKGEWIVPQGEGLRTHMTVPTNDKLVALLGKDASKHGQMYREEIPSDHYLLNWEKPINEQPQRIWDILKEKLENTYDLSKYKSGASLYYQLSKDLGSDEAASKYLDSIGIKGHSYFDQLSRAKGEGTRNYVTYNDKSVDIRQKYYGKTKVNYDEYIKSQHENGVMGLSKHELQNTIDASQVEQELSDPHSEAEKLKAQSDAMEASMRDKAAGDAFAEHDAWKQRISTLDGAYAELQRCLMGGA